MKTTKQTSESIRFDCRSPKNERDNYAPYLSSYIYVHNRNSDDEWYSLSLSQTRDEHQTEIKLELTPKQLEGILSEILDELDDARIKQAAADQGFRVLTDDEFDALKAAGENSTD